MISLRKLLLENITPQSDWFHVSFSTFQDSQGRRFSRGNDGQYKETSDSLAGKRYPAPQGSTDNQQNAWEPDKEAIARNWQHAFDATQDPADVGVYIDHEGTKWKRHKGYWVHAHNPPRELRRSPVIQSGDDDPKGYWDAKNRGWVIVDSDSHSRVTYQDKEGNKWRNNNRGYWEDPTSQLLMPRILHHPRQDHQTSQETVKLMNNRGYSVVPPQIQFIASAMRETFVENNETIPDIINFTNHIVDLKNGYPRRNTAAIYRVNPTPSLYEEYSDEYRMAEALWDNGSFGIHDSTLNVIGINAERVEEINSTTEITGEILNSLSTYVHEVLHSARSYRRSGNRFYDTPIGEAIEEGLTEYFSRAIMSGIVSDTSPHWKDYSNRNRKHNYTPYVNAIQTMAEHGDLDLEKVWDMDLERSETSEYMIVEEIRAAQDNVIQKIIEQYIDSDELAEELQDLAELLWDNNGMMLFSIHEEMYKPILAELKSSSNYSTHAHRHSTIRNWLDAIEKEAMRRFRY